MAINLKKILDDLHSAPPETKVVALTLLQSLPAAQLMADQADFRRLMALSEQGSQRGDGQVRDLFAQLRDRLQTMRHVEAPEADPDKVDLSGLGRGQAGGQIKTLLEVEAKGYARGLGEIRALLEVGALDRVTAVAVRVVGKLGSADEDLDRIRKFLGHPAGRVRADAVWAFASLADGPTIMATLGPALGDRHPHVRLNGIRALAKVGAAEITARLDQQTASENPEVRARALPLLSHLRGPDILELVRRLAADTSDAIRVEVANILRAHGGQPVASTLEWLAQDKSPQVKMAAMRAILLLKSGRGARPGFDVQRLDSVPDAPAAVEDIPDLVPLDPQAQVQTLMRLKLAGPVEAYDPVLALLEQEEKLRVEVAASVLSAFAVLGGREDVPRVRPFLAHSDGRVRANGVEAIDVMGGRKEILTWLTPLLADPIPRVKTNVLLALGRFGEAVFLNHLNRMLHSQHVPVRISGVYALAHYPGANAKQLAQHVLQDKEVEVRLNFAEALAGKPEAWTKEVLQVLAEKDPAGEVRDAATTSIETPVAAPVPEAAPRPDAAVPAPQPAAPAAPTPDAAPPPAADAPAAAPPPATGAGPEDLPSLLPPEHEGLLPVRPAGTEDIPTTAFRMVDGIPMCAAPDLPPPSVRLSADIVGEDQAKELERAADEAFRPSIDVAHDEVMAMAKQAAEAASTPEPAPPPAAVAAPPPGDSAGEAAEDAGGGEVVMESMSALGDSGESTDSLGQTFMNFAALISPGKIATMKKVQALEKERDEILERFGRSVWEKIAAGELQHEGFNRTIFVLKKYLHSMKESAKKGGKEEGGGWLGGLFGGGDAGAGGGEPPQLRAQYRNLAKDALKLRRGEEIPLDDFHSHLKSVDKIDGAIRELSEAED